MGGMKQEVASVKSQMSSFQNTMKDMQQSQNAGFERLAQMIGGAGSRPSTPRPNVAPAGASDDGNANGNDEEKAAADFLAANDDDDDRQITKQTHDSFLQSVGLNPETPT
eukprot:3497158-Karenia_brevis.AAC.1